MKELVCVVGAGISGLLAANKLLDDGKEVIVLEKNNRVGGLATNIVKGRFEFKNPTTSFYLGKNDQEYSLEHLYPENHIKFANLNEMFNLVSQNKRIVMPFGKDNVISTIENAVPGSYQPLLDFFELAYECREAKIYIAKHAGNLDYEYIKEEFDNFMRVSSYSVSQVFDTLGVPIAAQEILNAYWLLIGSSETELSFVDYSVMLLNAIEYGIQVPVNGSYDVALNLADDFLAKGGTIRLNAEVSNIICEDGVVNGVKLVDGSVIYCNHVICNSGLKTVYGKLFNPEDLPREVFKNINSRTVGGKLFTVHLGLNRSAEELGLNNYLNFIYHTLDSDVELEKMKDIAWGSQMALVPNVINSKASPDGTCIVSLTTVYFGDVFEEYTDRTNYYRDTREIAQRLIDVFQKFMKVNISDYIEEIEVITPIDCASLTGDIDGATYGFKYSNLDNLLPRLLNQNQERYVKGLEICNGFDGDLFEYGSNIYSGYQAYENVEKTGE